MLNVPPDETQDTKKLVLHPLFNKTIEELSKLNISIPYEPTHERKDLESYFYPGDGKLSPVEKPAKLTLDARLGEQIAHSDRLLLAYDESINKFLGLEGIAYVTAHALVTHGKSDFIPAVFLTFYFYTRSNLLTKNSNYLRYSDKPEETSNRDYVTDRSTFLLENVPDNSILFIDGPLIGGQVSHFTTLLNEHLLKRDIVPIFLVKNSASNLVSDNDNAVRGKFNSDMHWAYKLLRPGERTRFFRYVDKHNERYGKIFCYMKAFDVSPQRVEFHVDTYEKYWGTMGELMNLVYYLMLVQGDYKNPQLRTIAIAEKYARATIRLIDVRRLMDSLGITPTMNQGRFG